MGRKRNPDARRRQPLYSIFHAMHSRCRNPSARNYCNYGGRGIRVCDRWSDYEMFVADMGPRPPGQQLDRIDNDGDYSPENCRWATRGENNRNKRTNHYVTIDGERLVLHDWCARFGVSVATVLARISQGESYKQALARPVDGRVRSDNRMVSAFGETLRISEWARRFNIDRKVIAYRLRRGWLAEDAISLTTANNGYAHGRRFERSKAA